MRNEDVYRLAREIWEPWLKSAGFVRSGSRTTDLVKAGLWLLPLEPPVGRAERLLICVEADRYGWSPQMGGRFRVLLGAGGTGRDWPGLTQEQRAESMRINHAVLDRLDREFEPVATMRRNVDNALPGEVWVHFLDENDVHRWLDVLGDWIPTVLAHLAGDEGVRRLLPDRS